MMPVTLPVALALSSLLSALPSAAQETRTPEVSPSSLTEALERVHAVAPQRRAAQARIQAAEGTMRQANRLPNPSLDLHQENLGAGAPLDRTLDIFASDTLDPKTRRVTIRCQAPNSDGRLKPYMYATVSLGQSESRSTVAAPSQAIQDLGGKPVVFVAGENGVFTPRDVEIGLESEGWIEILSGLRVGEKIATTGGFLLKSELSRSALQEEE